MALDCIDRSDEDELPCTIVDTSTLSISLDNMGIATLSVSILTKDYDQDGCEIDLPSEVCEFDLGSVVFRGYIESDSPVPLQGTKYTEHRVVARGEICEPSS